MKKRHRKNRSRSSHKASTATLPTAAEAATKRADQMQNGYDITAESNKRNRRTSKIEYGPEEQQLPPYKRHAAISFLRDLQRNYTQAQSMLRQLSDNVIGQKVKFNTTDTAWNTAATWWFNTVFAADVYARDDLHLDDFNATLYLSTVREHDCLIWFDAGGLLAKGKFVAWESDQIAPISNADFKKNRKRIAKILNVKDTDALDQNAGVIRERGVVKGWFVHSGRGVTQIKYADATIIPRGPGLLLKRRFRIHQDRGVAALLTSAKNLIDSGEILDAERLTAKTLAHFALAIETDDAHYKAIGRQSSTTNPSTADPGEELTGSTPTKPRNYKNFERLTAGAIEYLEKGDKVTPLPNPRPGPQIQSFVDHQGNTSGASLGLPRLYALLQANSSYSAARAETNIAQVTFGKEQTWLERYPLRFELRHAIPYAITTGDLNPCKDTQWLNKASWDHPTVKPIDRLKDSKANSEDLNNLTKSLQDLLGPDWKEHIDQIADEKAYILEKLGKMADAGSAGPGPSKDLEDLKDQIITEILDQIEQEHIQ